MLLVDNANWLLSKRSGLIILLTIIMTILSWILSTETNVTTFISVGNKHANLGAYTQLKPWNHSMKHPFVILFWTKYFRKNWPSGWTQIKQCSAGLDSHHNRACVVTHNKTRLPEADAVVFHCRAAVEHVTQLLANRLWHQIFIFACMESPENTGILTVMDRIG